MSTVGRNDRCPCGSGKKYKKCCLHGEQARSLRVATEGPQPHTLDLTKLKSRGQVAAAADQLLDLIESGHADDELLDAIESLADAYPDHYLVHYVRGVFHAIVDNDSHKALPHFEHTVAMQPKMAEAQYNLGEAYLDVGRINEAYEALNTAIRVSRAGDGIASQARASLQEIEKIVRSTSNFRTLAEYVENQRRFEDAYKHHTEDRFEAALEGYRQVLEKDPDHVQSYGNMALVQAQLGHKAIALSLLEKALELDPEYQLAAVNRVAIAAMEEGKPNQLGSMGQLRYNELKDRVRRTLAP